MDHFDDVTQYQQFFAFFSYINKKYLHLSMYHAQFSTLCEVSEKSVANAWNYGIPKLLIFNKEMYARGQAPLASVTQR